ncbi:MAG: class I SAM-dependent RNA methyltransferase [Acidobacteriota bacterium]
MTTNNPAIIGSEYEVRVEKLVYGGQGLARLATQVIFIPASVPGDLLRVRISAIEKGFLRGEIVEILTSSSARRIPPCKFFGVCGGCQLQHLNYPAQLAAKAEFIRDSLVRLGHIEWSLPIEIKHGPEFGYRARAQFKIGRGTKPLQIGFYQATSHQVCDIDHCPILVPELNDALTRLHSAADEIAEAALPYSKIEVAAGIGTTAAHPPAAKLSTQSVFQQAFGIDYYFDPECFFQVNRFLLETLIETVIGVHNGQLAVDLYAGVGLFALQLARRYEKVVAVEVNPRAATWIAHNISVNQVTNIEFNAISAERWLAKQAIRIGAIDLVVLDPPRAGVSQAALKRLIDLHPAEIVYVSCDPTTLARDLRVLLNAGFHLQSITGVDLFPQSYHIETVAALTR